MIKFDQLYQEYARDVFRFALYLCGEATWADDLTSETFVRALTRGDSLKIPTVKAYLFAIVRNLYLKEIQRERRYERLNDHLLDRSSSPEIAVEKRAELRAFVRGLQTLSEIDRAALLMRTYHDMPYQEIAAALSISLAAVRVKVYRARLKLIELRAQESDGGSNERNHA